MIDFSRLESNLFVQFVRCILYSALDLFTNCEQVGLSTQISRIGKNFKFNTISLEGNPIYVKLILL